MCRGYRYKQLLLTLVLGIHSDQRRNIVTSFSCKIRHIASKNFKNARLAINNAFQGGQKNYRVSDEIPSG